LVQAVDREQQNMTIGLPDGSALALSPCGVELKQSRDGDGCADTHHGSATSAMRREGKPLSGGRFARLGLST